MAASSSRSTSSDLGDCSALRQTPGWTLFVVFAVAGVLLRAIFWRYTGRTWEDALIALSSARNLWDGIGWVHHAGEARVQSFTSPLGQVLMVAGEAFHAGLATMRVASLAASVLAAFYAFRVGALLSFHWSAQLLLLAYLATDQLQIFFGMSGLETQVATALVFANAWYYLSSQWTKLGVACGLATICRPEFLLWGLIVAAAVPIWHRRAFVRVAVPALLIAGAWFGFAAIYYGSPVPHTIAVKAASVPQLDVERIGTYVAGMWAHVAPLLQFWQAGTLGLPTIALQVVVGLVAALAVAGAITAVRARPRLLAVLGLLVGFILYRTLMTVNPYYMWYLPPFTALLFLFAAAGVGWLSGRSPSAAIVVATLVAAAYALHLPFSMPLDREMQVKIEDGVRRTVGARLDELMAADDSVVLEPPGYIGWGIRPKTVHDYPGLTSPGSFVAFVKHHTMTGLILELAPRFVVQRPHERQDFEEREPELAARYEAVETIRAETDLEVRRGGLVYRPIDVEFTIYRRAGD